MGMNVSSWTMCLNKSMEKKKSSKKEVTEGKPCEKNTLRRPATGRTLRALLSQDVAAGIRVFVMNVAFSGVRPSAHTAQYLVNDGRCEI